ncbi:MAG: hypothetical protein WBA13_01885 [Microcoleaceae cyanobacterium]
MEYHNQEVTLKVSSRPLRCVYLVQDREEVLDAVALYTHMWGGAANAILPIPIDNSEAEDFKKMLQLINPDFIFVQRDKLSDNIIDILNKLPIQIKFISQDKVQNHINNNNPLYLSSGRISQMRTILLKIHPNPIQPEHSNIRTIDQKYTEDFGLALQFGRPSRDYQNFIVQYLGATPYKNPDNISDFIKLSLVLSKFINPASLTMLETQKDWNRLINYHKITGDKETLCLFLDDGQDMGIATVFWNCRWIVPHNKVFLPREDFIQDLETHATLIAEFMPHLRGLFITTPLDLENAVNLQKNLESIFTKVMKKKILVKVVYKDFKFDWIPRNICYNKTRFTRTIASDGCVRFEPLIPVGHDNTNFTFAYDTEVSFKSGKPFFSPYSLAGSRLLTNDLLRIEYAESFGHDWLLHDLLVRSTPKGITGIALPSKESCFYIHSDELVIIHQLKEIGLETKLNQNTLYVQGLVKRLNGIEKVVHLINNGGADIIRALYCKTDNSRIDQNQIFDFLKEERNMNPEEARKIKKIIKSKLQPLLSSNLIYRGFILQCPNCNLKNWLNLNELQEFVECKGCAESFQIPIGKNSQEDRLSFAYKLNELAHQLIQQEGGLAVLQTASSLRRVLSPTTGYMKFGGNIFKVGSKKIFAEVDIFYLTEEGLIISECKGIFGKKDQKELEEKVTRIQESLERNINFAVRANVKVIILGISSNLSLTEIPNLSTVINRSVANAKKQGIGLHLIYNDKLYLWGENEIPQLQRIRFANLTVPEEFYDYEWGIGEFPTNYGGSVGINGLFDQQVLINWENDLKE